MTNASTFTGVHGSAKASSFTTLIAATRAKVDAGGSVATESQPNTPEGISDIEQLFTPRKERRNI